MDSILWCLCSISSVRPVDISDGDRLAALWICQSTLDDWLTLAIWVIVAGLVFELLEWVPPKWLRIWIAPRLPWPALIPALHRLRHGAIRAGEILVIAGVASELALHINSSGILTEVRGIQDARDVAQQKIIADTNKKASDANLAAWRVIDPNAKPRMQAILAEAPSAIEIDWPQGDPEVGFFAFQVIDVFTKAKWSVGCKIGLYPGFLLDEAISGTDEAAIQRVISAFKETGFTVQKSKTPKPVSFVPCNDIGPTSIMLVIGSKLRDSMRDVFNNFAVEHPAK